MSTEIFSNIYNGPFKRYLLISRIIGQDVENQSKITDLAFQAELQYLQHLENFSKPSAERVILNPIEDQINKITYYVSEDPSMADHINVIGHSIKALLWIQQRDPVSYLEEIIGDTKAYTDILLAFFKEKEPHTEWVDAWLETLNDINNFVRRKYPKGLLWKIASDAPDSSSSGDLQQSEHKFDKVLFDEINNSETIQPASRVKNQSSSEIEEKHMLETTDRKNEIFIQEGKKWRIEHNKGNNKHLTIDQATTDNVVYVYDCSNITIVIEKKINVIKLDSCEKVCVIFRSLISGIEMIACKNLKLHAFGTLPSMNADGCSDINLHLTRKGLDIQVMTSQCAKMSLSYPLDDGYYRTFYIPNRLMTTVNADHTLNTCPLVDE